MLFCRAMKPALKLLVSVLVCWCKLNNGHFSFYHKCIVMWDWTQHWRLEMSVFFKFFGTTWNVSVLYFLVCRALKPSMKTFGVSVGLSCKLNNDTFLFYHTSIVMWDWTQHWELEMSVFFFCFFLDTFFTINLEWWVIGIQCCFVFDRVSKPALNLLASLLICHANQTFNFV